MVSTMISQLKGTLESKGEGFIELSVGGVTFKIHAPTSTLDLIGENGETVKLLTSLQFRQESINIYGFITENDRIAFEALININGVGPRLAIAVLSIFDASSLASAVQAEDSDTFTRVPGVGKRTASRILLELKGKFDQVWEIPDQTSLSDDVFDSLTALGYSVQEARNAISKLPSRESGKPLTTEEKLRHALQYIISS